MWIAFLIVVVAVVAGWFWVVLRDKYLCPICRHAMAQHEPPKPEGDFRTRPYCMICRVECQ